MNAKNIDENMVSGIKWWLNPFGVKARVFILEKSGHLSGVRVLSSNIQQGLLGTRHVSSLDWWSAWKYCLGQLFLGRGHISDTCSVALAAATLPYQLLSVPASCNRTRSDLLVVVVRWMWSTRSLRSVGCGVVQTDSWPGRPASDLVGGFVEKLKAC